MTASSTRNTLQQYLAVVKQADRPAQPKVGNKKYDSSVKPIVNQSNMKPIDELLSDLQQTYDWIKQDIQTLTQEQLIVAQQFLMLTSGRSIAYMEAVAKLSETLSICKLKLKLLLASLLDKQIIINVEHVWKEQQIKLASIWIEPLLLQAKVNHTSPNLGQCESIVEESFLPFNKQLIFLMHQLKNCSLQFNQLNKINKQQLDELRNKVLELNPMLILLEDSLFTQRDEKQEREVEVSCAPYNVEDAVVSFILKLASSLQFIQREKNRIVWIEQNWLKWLECNEAIKTYSLKLIMTELLFHNANSKLHYWFLKLIMMPNHWVMLEKNDNSNRYVSFAIKLAYIFGWIEAVYDAEGHWYIKRKLNDYVKHTEPVVFNQLSVYCFEDCSPVAIWHMLHIGQLQQRLEILKFQLEPHSVLRAFKAGYTERQIKSLLNINSESPFTKAWDRVKSLCLTLEQNISNSSEGKINQVKRKTYEDKMVQTQVIACPSFLQLALGYKNTKTATFLEVDIQRSRKQINTLPSSWFTSLRVYNTVTLKRILTEAITIGLEVELIVNNECLLLIPISALDEDELSKETVISFLYPSNQKKKYIARKVNIALSTITKIRLINIL